MKNDRLALTLDNNLEIIKGLNTKWSWEMLCFAMFYRWAKWHANTNVWLYLNVPVLVVHG